MKIVRKYKHTFEIEYEIKLPESRYADNDPKMTIIFSFNKKQVKAYKKGLALTVKYLKKMERLGFKVETQSEGKEQEANNGEV